MYTIGLRYFTEMDLTLREKNTDSIAGLSKKLLAKNWHSIHSIKELSALATSHF